MFRRKQRKVGRSALDLMDESVHLLRHAPASVLMAYCIGSFPFVLALLFFWGEMSRGTFANLYLPEAALTLAILFLWMKGWQTFFATRLQEHFCGVPFSAWGWRRWWRTLVAQSIVQATGFLLIPASLLAAVPFGWFYAFYQNFTCLGNGIDKGVRAPVKAAWRQAKWANAQNLLLVWLLSPWILIVASFLVLVVYPLVTSAFKETGSFGTLIFSLGIVLLLVLSPLSIAVAIDVGAGLFLLPQLLRSLFGIETNFTLAGSSVLNTTFLAAVVAITFLIIDPLAKTCYMLRCFYGASVQSGEDLLASLRSLRRQRQRQAAGLLVLLLFLLPVEVRAAAAASNLPATGQMPAAAGAQAPVRAEKAAAGQDSRMADVAAPNPNWRISTQDMQHAIRTVMQSPAYRWRLPREAAKEEKQLGWLADFMQGVHRLLGKWWQPVKKGLAKCFEWIRKLFTWKWQSSSTGKPSQNWGWLNSIDKIMIGISIALLAAILFLIARHWLRHREQTEVAAGTAGEPAPDLMREDIAADQLPEDEWMQLARQMIKEGQLRLGMRALFLATLSFLAGRKCLTIRKSKSDLEYRRELARRAHGRTSLVEAFDLNVRIYERGWYGRYEVSLDQINEFTANLDRMKENAPNINN